MRDLADQSGFRYRTTRPPWRMRLGDRWATEAEQATRDERFEEFYSAVADAGAAGKDVSIASVVDSDDPAYPLFETVIHAEWGVSPTDASTLDSVHYRDTDENWPLQDGYGALVARHAEGIPVETSTPVWRIDWSGPRVKVTTPDGTVEAGAVVVTVSTNVLTAELIGFEPGLPDWKLAAAEAVPLGRANKVAFGIDGKYLGVEEHTNIVVPVDGRGMMNFQLRPFGADLANGYLAGPLCRDLEEAGEAEMLATSLEALAGALGSEVAKHVIMSACSRWGMEPFILGAYAAAKPGHAHRRADLGKPLDDRVFFAGEATSAEFFSTCHGAHLTGIEAAKAAAVALGRVVTLTP
jgi:monoamine oxidase